MQGPPDSENLSRPTLKAIGSLQPCFLTCNVKKLDIFSSNAYDASASPGYGELISSRNYSNREIRMKTQPVVQQQELLVCTKCYTVKPADQINWCTNGRHFCDDCARSKK